MAKGKSKRKKACLLAPLIDGKKSELYQELLKKTNDRPLTNLIYAAYLQSGVAAKMDIMGYQKNSQGQHTATDVYTFFDVSRMERESLSDNIFMLSERKGIIDAYGNAVDFENAKEALTIASQINKDNVGVVAHVNQHGDKFNVIIQKKDSFTQLRVNDVNKQLRIWESIKSVLNEAGIDIEDSEFNKEHINPLRGEGFVQWLDNVKFARNDVLSHWEIQTILKLGENSTQVGRLKTMFGSIEEASKTIYEAYRDPKRVTPTQMAFIHNTLDSIKTFTNINLSKLYKEVNSIKDSSGETVEANIHKTLKDLNDEYGINKDEIHLIGKDIDSLSTAAAAAAIVLKRQLSKLQLEQGVTDRTKDLENSLRVLRREIKNNKYYAGILGFLKEANNQFQYMEDLINNTPQTGTRMENASMMSKALMEIKNISTGYFPIVKALSSMDKLLTEESINSADKAVIEEQAKKLLNFYDKYEKKISALRTHTMLQIAEEYLGDKKTNSPYVATSVIMSEADSTIWDHLYSVGRLSDPLLATMGSIIRDAQSERDAIINNISVRIRRAEFDLKKAGFTSEFMYESNGYIISDIDWTEYNISKSQAFAEARKLKLKGLSLIEYINDWEEANTEERVVDNKNGRTEKVPNSLYRKPMPSLHPAQLEYYKEMMQLKGEIGSLLPSYAQNQYRPPQIRRDFWDAISKAKGLKDVYKAIKNRIKDAFVIREDDPSFAQNGIILGGQEYGVSDGDMSNNPLRQIPIFFINKLEDQKELLKDFSGALQSLAGTAVNYYSMNNIKDTVEFMGDFIKRQKKAATKGGLKQVDSLIDESIAVFEDLEDFSFKSGTIGIIDGFIAQHLYGKDLQKYNKFTVFLKKLLTHSSSRMLSVNVTGQISNVINGEIQMLIEAGAMEFYNPIDYAWAISKVFGDNTIGAPGRIMDFLNNEVNSKASLLSQRFDPLNDNFQDASHTRYYKGPLRHLLGQDFRFIGYGMGEHMLHFTNMYAVLHSTKVYLDGKKIPLYDILTTSDKVSGNKELLYNKNAYYKNENGEMVPIDDAFLDKVRDTIREVNQSCFGSMNTEDKGIINQFMLGRYVMNLRQWMVEHYSRRFRREYWNANTKDYREGFYITTYRYMYGLAGDLFNFQREAMLHWEDMNDMQKSNVRRALSEHIVLASLFGLSFILGDIEDHKREFWIRMWIYQTKRAIMETSGSTPLGIPTQITALVNSPIAATNTINAYLYVITGLGDLNDTIKSGPDKGENKYLRNIKRYVIPYWGQIDRLLKMDEEDDMFAIFNRRWM